MAEKSDPNYKVIAENRRARFDYFIESDLEVGIVLTGSEVKSLRTGQSNIADSYASVEGSEGPLAIGSEQVWMMSMPCFMPSA